MMTMPCRSTWARSSFWFGLSMVQLAGPAAAQSSRPLDQQIEQLQRQIQLLQQQLDEVRQSAAQSTGGARRAATAAPQPIAPALHPPAAATAAAPVAGRPPSQPGQPRPTGLPGDQPAVTAGGQASGATGPGGSIRVGGVTLTVGGFLAAEGVFRSSNITADIGSNYTAIPLAQSPNAHTGEFRGSARQSRLSLLAAGQISAAETATGYVETDFLGVGTASNSNESNSYVPRLRQAYLTYDNKDLNAHVLAGQSWSLVTMNRVGITPRQENIPLTIDAQYVPGFNWKRQWQLRADADMADHKLWLGVSLEAPQSTYAAAGPNGLTGLSTATVVDNGNAGGSLLNSLNSYSTDVAPDLVVKLAADPGYGHYELFGLGRLFHDRVSTAGAGRNNTVSAGGVGAGLLLPVIPRMLDVQFSGLAGYGIGSYGAGQLPDAVIGPSGAPEPTPEYELLVGLVGHPDPAVDLYAYGGTERIGKTAYTVGGRAFGYGNVAYAEGGCAIENAAAATCVGNTAGLTQGTVGAWYRFLRGSYGTLQAGAQYSYTVRDVFAGAGSTPGSRVSPSAADNMVYFSFRYLPYQ